MLPEVSMFFKISLHVAMQHVKHSSNLKLGIVNYQNKQQLCLKVLYIVRTTSYIVILWSVVYRSHNVLNFRN